MLQALLTHDETAQWIARVFDGPKMDRRAKDWSLARRQRGSESFNGTSEINTNVSGANWPESGSRCGVDGPSVGSVDFPQTPRLHSAQSW